MIVAEAPVVWFDEIDSTLSEARRRAESGDFSPVWLIAGRQNAGRGRRGRAWASLEGNLLATYLAATPRAPAEIALTGFAAGVAIRETIDEMIGAKYAIGRATLKWPNDVLIDGAKCAGIMLDSGAAGGGGNWAALAFGINLAATPEGLDQPATRLAAALPSDSAVPAPLAFLAALRPRLEAWDARLDMDGFMPLRAAWLSHAHGMGLVTRVALGEAIVEGRITGLSPRGELELLTADGPRLIAAGDILLPHTQAA